MLRLRDFLSVRLRGYLLLRLHVVHLTVSRGKSATFVTQFEYPYQCVISEITMFYRIDILEQSSRHEVVE